MKAERHANFRLVALVRAVWFADGAAQIVEFAVSLPLLVVFVVGIFDFSGAYTLKQKLANAARDAARAAAADPASDLSSATAVSVSDAFQIVDNYLTSNKINDCGISPTGVTPTGLTWTYAASTTGPPPCAITLIINRGYYFPQAGGGAIQTNCVPQDPGGVPVVIGTCVSIQYAYPWRFNRVIGLLGTNPSVPTNLTTTAVALNEN